MGQKKELTHDAADTVEITALIKDIGLIPKNTRQRSEQSNPKTCQEHGEENMGSKSCQLCMYSVKALHMAFSDPLRCKHTAQFKMRMAEYKATSSVVVSPSPLVVPWMMTS